MLVSAKGSPGVTASALALGAVWPRTALVVDVDPQGGDVLVGVGGGRQAAGRGIVEVLVEARHGDLLAALGRHVTRPVPHSPLVLAGFGAPGQAATVPWAPLADLLAGLPDTDVLADCGRYYPGHPITALLRRSRFTVVVTGSSLRAVRATARVLAQLRAELGSDRGRRRRVARAAGDRPGPAVLRRRDRGRLPGRGGRDAAVRPGRGAGVDRRRPPGPVVSPVGAAPRRRRPGRRAHRPPRPARPAGRRCASGGGAVSGGGATGDRGGRRAAGGDDPRPGAGPAGRGTGCGLGLGFGFGAGAAVAG